MTVLYILTGIIILILVISITDKKLRQKYPVDQRLYSHNSSPDPNTPLQEFNKILYYPNLYDTPQIVTGDHYKAHFLGEDTSFDKSYFRCLHAGTATCVNCARRSEIVIDSGRRKYGMGINCKEEVLLNIYDD